MGGGSCFSDGKGFIFKWGGVPCGGIDFDGKVIKKNCRMGGHAHL